MKCQKDFYRYNRQCCRGQYWICGNGLSIDSGVRRSADRATVVGCGRVAGMGVRGLHRPHHAHQRNAEQTNCSD